MNSKKSAPRSKSARRLWLIGQQPLCVSLPLRRLAIPFGTTLAKKTHQRDCASTLLALSYDILTRQGL
jgi:hypothetical protein